MFGSNILSPLPSKASKNTSQAFLVGVGHRLGEADVVIEGVGERDADTDTDGVTEGIAEADKDGVADTEIEADVDGVTDGVTEAEIDGVADGVAETEIDGVTDGDREGETGTDGSDDKHRGMLMYVSTHLVPGQHCGFRPLPLAHLFPRRRHASDFSCGRRATHR